MRRIGRKGARATRRDALALAGAAALAGWSVPAAALALGPARPFSFEALVAEARAQAAAPFRETAIRHADVLERIDYDAYQQIRFRPERALWAGGDGPFPVQLFHLGRYFKAPVGIHVVEAGQAREILYDPALFTFGTATFAAALPADLGFAGFRVQAPDQKTDWLAFLGAAYFRSSGELDQYGLSARGLAVDSGMATPEEFPRFTGFWLAEDPARPETVIVHALLDGPRVAGAFRIAASKTGPVVMDVEARLFARAPIERLGVAPLTSMFWYAEQNRRQGRDWRPEIHDSDGLALWTGAGERIWRPLVNPPTAMTNSFVDRTPRGFGLLQRDRDFANYQDDGVFYDRRPSVWVEPRGDWGEGAVQLVELPTDDEIHDNIVAFWRPAEPVTAGWEGAFDYRLHWVDREPFPPAVGRVVATRTGMGGVPGQPRPADKVKFVVDFAGGPLEHLVKADKVVAVIEAGRGAVDNDYALQVVGTRTWRAFFDLKAEGTGPVNLRMFLRLGERALTETWLYQHFPGAA